MYVKELFRTGRVGGHPALERFFQAFALFFLGGFLLLLTRCTPLDVGRAVIAAGGSLPLLTKTVLFAKVSVAPVCPAELSPPSADCQPQPLQAEVVLQTSDGSVDIAILNSNGDGYLGFGLVGLPGGAYRLHPLSPRPGLPPFPPEDLRVTITTDEVVFVEILYDSGIR